MASGHLIEARGLGKRYGEQRALRDFDLTVAEGTVCAVLGPNGAGKTTAVRILTTLLHADEGEATVAGFDVRRRPRDVKRHIGLVGQSAAVDEILGGRENLVLFGRLYGLRPAEARVRADELLAQFDLQDAGDKPVSAYSGGMRRRLDLAASLIVRPPMLFLDEPTTGLDPRSRSEVWQSVRGLVEQGTTLLLTTQYLEEADRLADRVTLVDHGSVIAEGTPAELKGQVDRDRVEVVVGVSDDLAPARAVLAAVGDGRDVEIDEQSLTLSVPVRQRMAALEQTMAGLTDAGVEADDIGIRRPTLDEAFLRLTAADQSPHRPEVTA